MGRRRLTIEQVEAIRAERKAGVKQTALAAQYGVSQSTIHAITEGFTYKQRSPVYEEAERRLLDRLYDLLEGRRVGRQP